MDKPIVIYLYCEILLKIKKEVSGFPGGSVLKNPLANAGDIGSIPGWGRSHMMRSS